MAIFDPRSQSIFDDIPGRSAHVNACIGENGVADFETYATGYFEAAEVLLKCVLNPETQLTQDTLVYPIIFSFRHGIELSIKRVNQVLSEAGVSNGNTDQGSHDLKKLWSGFLSQAKADRRLLKTANILTPVVDQIHEADPLAQEFRYATKKDGARSLSDKRIIDLFTVLELVAYAKSHFDSLFRLIETIREERKFGSFTSSLNREELRQLSLELPSINTWIDSGALNLIKNKWKKEFGLGSKALTEAINFIKSHREFAGNIGKNTPLEALTEGILNQLIEVSLAALADSAGSDTSAQKKRLFHNPINDYFNKTGIILTMEIVRETSSLFYLGRDGRYSEEYPLYLNNHTWCEKPVTEKVIRQDFMHVFRKPSFVQHMCRALRMTGNPQLASKYEKMLEPVKASLPTFREVRFSDFDA